MSKTSVARIVPGTELGASGWVTVTQEMIWKFSEGTLDADPMHTSPEWARDKGPFPYTVAFGFQTMSLLTHMMHDVMQEGYADQPGVSGYYLNYGFNRMRLIEPVPVGARIRGHFRAVDTREDDKGRALMTVEVRVEIEDVERPALVGEWLSMWVPPPAE